MKTLSAAVLLAGLCLTGGAIADELKPAAASSLSLGPVSGIAYYTEESDGFRVVTTLSAGETAAPIRFVATLQPGQKTLVSVPREPEAEAVTVEIARVGNRIHVSRTEKLASLAR